MIDQLTILSPGLLGGSVALAARAKGAARRTVVWARRPETRHAISREPWCDKVAETPEAAVEGANLVVIASPVDVVVPLIRHIATHVPEGAVVTDVGSVKREIVEHGHDFLGERAPFVGSHPMAGSEKTGWEHGSATLFEGHTCFVTPLPDTNPAATELVERFWTLLGGRVVRVAPAEHDQIVAHISHLPQILASSLCAFLADQDTSWRSYAGGGLRDTTRIAASNPALWRTILSHNREEVQKALRHFKTELEGFQDAIASENWDELERRLARGKDYRENFPPR
jgi:cyclohexadieny/prephenate dehydrogenase